MASVSPAPQIRDILSSLKITAVYQALTGITPRHTGRNSARAPAAWRGGDGQSVAMDDSRGVWHDFAANAGGGILDLIVQVRGGNRADALRWAAEFTGIPLDNRSLSPAERYRWAQHRRLMEQELPKARYWRRAAITMSEELLVVLKAPLLSGLSDRIDFDGIRETTRLLATLRCIDGSQLVTEFHSWMKSHPELTSAMIQAAQMRETVERRAVQAFLLEMNLAEAQRA